MRLIKLVAALAALFAIAAVPPLLLLTFVGSPWPDQMSWDSELTDTSLIKLLSGIVWLLWLQTMWCVVVELIGAARSTDTSRAPGTFGIQQHMVRAFIGAVVAGVVAVPILTVVATAANASESYPHEMIPTQETSPPVVDAEPQPAEDAAQQSASSEAQLSTVVVQRGDTLWKIAEQHLGDGERWTDIASVNENRTMADGVAFHAGNVIRQGWELQIPTASAHDGQLEGDGEADYTIKPGDTLSQIALDKMGDAAAWPELFAASRKLDQPTAMVDPDLIYPGQLVDIPTTTTPVVMPGFDQAETAPTSPQHPTTQTEPDTASVPKVSLRAIEGSTGAQDTPAVGGAAPGETDLHETSGDTDQNTPGWIMPGLTGGGALLAGAMLLALRRRRASQQRSRRPGRTITAPGPVFSTVEKSVTVAGEQATNTVQFVDEALRRTAATIGAANNQMPDLAAVEVTDTALVLHLRSTATPTAPWIGSDDQLLWLLDRHTNLATIGPDPRDRPAPWPLLVTIGHDNKASTWMLNFENLTVSVTGDSAASADFARFVAAEVVCNPWSSVTTLDVMGVASEVAPMSPDRIRVHQEMDEPAAAAIADAVRTIDRLAQYETDTASARATQTDPDPWDSHILIADESTPSDALNQLTKLIDDHPGKTATTVILRGDAGLGLEVHIDEQRQLTVPAINLTVSGTGLTTTEAHGCAALLAQAASLDDSSIPDFPDTEGWKSMATSAGALREQYRVPRSAGTIEPSGSLLQGPDAEYTSVAATTVADLEALAPKVTETTRAQVAGADPTLDADLHEWGSTTCARPRLSLLGPVTARTSGVTLDRRKAYYTEVFAYLATRPNGATTDEVAAAFDITPARARIDVNKVREWLGTDPTTGERYLPDARQAPSAAARGVGVYEVVNPIVDTDLFRRLRLRGESKGPEGIADLSRALQLVQGPPFEQLRAGGWGWMLEGDRLDMHMVCAIADVAHVVVTHHLRTGDLTSAQTTASIARMASPNEEISRLDLAAVLDAQGHTEEAARIVRDEVCNRSDDGGAPDDLPTRTAEVIRNRGWLNKQAI